MKCPSRAPVGLGLVGHCFSATVILSLQLSLLFLSRRSLDLVANSALELVVGLAVLTDKRAELGCTF